MKLKLSFFAVALLAGWLFATLHAPVAWLLGPMVAGIAASGLLGGPHPLPPVYQAVGQALIGLATGVSFPLATMKAAAGFAFPLLFTVLLTAGTSLLVGYLLWRRGGLDRATSFLGMLPGAASSMVAMSDEMGADAVLVAVLQYLRLLMVSFLTPLALGYIFPEASTPAVAVAQTAAPVMPLLWDLPLLGLVALIGAWAGRRIRMPAPSFLGPFFAALLLSWTLPVQLTVPAPVYAFGMLLMGLSIGVRFDLPAARRLGRAALIEVVGVLALMGFALGVGYVFHLTTGVPTVTAVLGSTPGGMETMVATSVDLGGDTGLVLAMQMVRWFLILLVGPWVAGRLSGKNEPRGGLRHENGSGSAGTSALG